MPTIHASQSITRRAAILVLRSRGPWVIYSHGMAGATLSRARLVHPARIFVHCRRHRMCVSATDCVIDGGACSSLASRFLQACARARARTCRPLFFPSERSSFAMSYLRQCNETIYGEFAKSLPQDSREYSLRTWSKRFLFWARTQREMRESGLVSELNTRNMLREWN